ncbi:hypothetical protein HY793_02710 [Candidatus Desantisbacteria bacterium]|nr:hypothetical protein [Candidatus Desantisbacteria bacterium]
MFKHLLLLFAIFIITTPTEANSGLKHYEIALLCNKNKVECEGIHIKYSYAERDKNIQSFPGANAYKMNMVSFAGRTLKTLYFSIDKKASADTQGNAMTEESKEPPKQKSYNLFKDDSLYKVKRKVKQDIEEQAIEDERMKILDKQQIILHIPYLENASRIEIYNAVGQKIQTIRLDGIIK